MAEVTEADAEDFKMFLVGQKLAPTTIHKRLQFARMFFRAAKKRTLIADNPFAEVTAKAVDRTASLTIIATLCHRGRHVLDYLTQCHQAARDGREIPSIRSSRMVDGGAVQPFQRFPEVLRPMGGFLFA